MRSDNYIVIQGWMCNELNLKGNDLLIFALIHGFSQDEESRFSGSRKYIADTFNISLPTVDKALKNLIEQNLINQHKTEKNGIISYEYNSLPGVKKLYRVGKETLPGGGKVSLPNNIVKQKDNKKDRKVISKDITTDPGNFLKHHSSMKSQNLYSKCVSLIHDFTKDKNIQRSLLDYLDFRLEKGKVENKPLYANMWKGMINKLAKDFKEEEWLDIINQSIENGWMNFYPPKVIKKSKYGDARDIDPAKINSMTKEEKQALRDKYKREGRKPY